MQGRYGVDSLSRFLLIAGVVLVGISSIVDLWILYVIAWALLIYSYVRVFSRNHAKRAAENQIYLNRTYKIRSKCSQLKNRLAQSRYYHIYKCPGCKQKIRIPRGKGKIEIRCPKCSTTFVKKS